MTTSSAKSNNFFTVNSLDVGVGKVGFEYFANNYLGVFIADKIGWNFGVLLAIILCTLELLYKMQTKATQWLLQIAINIYKG